MTQRVVRALALLAGLTCSAAYAAKLDGNNQVTPGPGQYGWTVAPNTTTDNLTIWLNRETTDGNPLTSLGADLELRITGSGTLPTMSNLTLSGSGLLFNGGFQGSISGNNSSDIYRGTLVGSPVTIPDTPPSALATFSLSTTGVAPGDYTLDFSSKVWNAAGTAVYNASDQAMPLDMVTGTIHISAVPEPSTWVALAGLAILGGPVVVYQYRRRAQRRHTHRHHRHSRRHRTA